MESFWVLSDESLEYSGDSLEKATQWLAQQVSDNEGSLPDWLTDFIGFLTIEIKDHKPVVSFTPAEEILGACGEINDEADEEYRYRQELSSPRLTGRI